MGWTNISSIVDVVFLFFVKLTTFSRLPKKFRGLGGHYDCWIVWRIYNVLHGAEVPVAKKRTNNRIHISS